MSTRYFQVFDRLAQILANARNAGVGVVGGAAYVNIGGTLVPIAQSVGGNTYYVNTNTGVDSNNGRSWATPFLTRETLSSLVGLTPAGSEAPKMQTFTSVSGMPD